MFLLYFDSWLLVLDKPAGLLSVPGRGPENADNLASRVQTAYPEALNVHRLDQATSGLIVMARDPATHRELSRQFAAREVQKSYLAIVAGQLAADSGQIDLPLAADWPNRPRQRIDHAAGKPAVTQWRVISRNPANEAFPGGTTRLELMPLTGRSHQLRVHLSALGHPIVGDALYAPAEIAPAEIAAAASRLLLHAAELRLIHPATKREMAWRAECPF